MQVINAIPEDAPLIATAIVNAIGIDHCLEIMDGAHDIEEIRALFEEMAARDDTQYSYRNALIAVDDAGCKAGVCVAYDGGRLEELRAPFLKRAGELFGLDPDVDDETEPGELYIDTLMVLPEHRRKGVGARLLEGVVERGRREGLTPGLLVDMENAKARALYDRMGFLEVGVRPFLGIPMHHMQKKLEGE